MYLHKITHYKQESFEQMESDFDRLSSEGWELINVIWAGLEIMAFWKKQK